MSSLLSPHTHTTPVGPLRPTPPALPHSRLTPWQTHTRVVSPAALAAADLQAWSALEARALEPNLYLSPHFVLPALRHLDPGLKAQLYLAERQVEGERRIIGLALLHSQAPTRHLPVPHLSAYQSRHSYLGPWLLDRDHAPEAATALLQQIRSHHPWAAALVLPNHPFDGEQQLAMQAAARTIGSEPLNLGRRRRALLIPAQAGPQSLRERMGTKQYNNNERCRRRLQERGTLSWQVLRGEVSESHLQDFLALEHQGWKQESGTSLRSNPADEAFFLDMARGLAREGRALFTELRLDDRVIASTANFVAGHTGFAFKVGWDEPLRKFGIGILNEAEFVQQAPQACADLHTIDSGSQPASFIEMLWPDVRELATCVVPLNRWGRWALHAQRKLASLKKQATVRTET